MSAPDPYLKALRFGWLTRFYDRLVRLLKEDKLKRLLIGQARIGLGHRVLDVGCGTATIRHLHWSSRKKPSSDG